MVPKAITRSMFCLAAVAVGTMSLINMSSNMSIKLDQPLANDLDT